MRLDDRPRSPGMRLIRFRLVKRRLHRSFKLRIAAAPSNALFQSCAQRDRDPNGIRTRVTAVKGRCPGPLDDRVTKARAISELLLLDARQIAELFSNFGT